jgi:hypothetical protein
MLDLLTRILGLIGALHTLAGDVLTFLLLGPVVHMALLMAYVVTTPAVALAAIVIPLLVLVVEIPSELKHAGSETRPRGAETPKGGRRR